MADSNIKSRYWTCIVYPDDVPDVQGALSSLVVRALLSPLHSPVNSADEHERVAHYHLILFFDGPVRVSVPQAIGLEIGIHSHLWRRVNDIVALSRYLVHLDNPEKEQYGPDACQLVTSFGGVDYFELIERSSDVLPIVRDMMDWVRENHIYYFSDLLDFSAACRPDWFRALVKSQRENMWRYINSLAYKERESDF